MSTVLRIAWLALSFGVAALTADAVKAAEPELRLPSEVQTFADGRLPIHQLFVSYLKLRQTGWQLDIVSNSQPTGTTEALPIIALRSPRTGPAVWILSGIHGEEPAGPNAVAAAIDDLTELGERHPVVLIPLCNPHGYARNWRT